VAGHFALFEVGNCSGVSAALDADRANDDIDSDIDIGCRCRCRFRFRFLIFRCRKFRFRFRFIVTAFIIAFSLASRANAFVFTSIVLFISLAFDQGAANLATSIIGAASLAINVLAHRIWFSLRQYKAFFFSASVR